VRDEPAPNIHQECGLSIETILKNALVRRTLDNVTVLMICLSNFKRKVFGSKNSRNGKCVTSTNTTPNTGGASMGTVNGASGQGEREKGSRGGNKMKVNNENMPANGKDERAERGSEKYEKLDKYERHSLAVCGLKREGLQNNGNVNHGNIPEGMRFKNSVPQSAVPQTTKHATRKCFSFNKTDLQ
jgi:hypothetical protein